MGRMLRPVRSPIGAIGLAALVVAAGGVAYATIPQGSGETIRGCVNKANGNLRVVSSADGCRTNESPIEWNREGPPGDGVNRLDEVTLDVGETRVLFSVGPLTFTAHCAELSVDTVRPSLTVTSAEDNSATVRDPDLDQGETVEVAPISTASQGDPRFLPYDFAASAADGTTVSGVLFNAVNALGKAGCTYGGHYVTG